MVRIFLSLSINIRIRLVLFPELGAVLYLIYDLRLILGLFSFINTTTDADLIPVLASLISSHPRVLTPPTPLACSFQPMSSPGHLLSCPSTQGNLHVTMLLTSSLGIRRRRSKLRLNRPSRTCPRSRQTHCIRLETPQNDHLAQCRCGGVWVDWKYRVCRGFRGLVEGQQ